ncbi:MAG: hypothetical protein IPJ65_06750 [Archangiaceae bacterium]|nr:hypothetical protein [Archangiaceae bacterium]
MRSLYGAPDESGQPNIYESSMKALPVQSWPGAAAQQRPLAVLTDGVSAPACAELAGTLRLLRAAWLFGEPVFATVAESSWQGWGQVGLGYRSMNLSSGGARWPERIDVDQADVDAALSGLAARGAVSEAAVMPATRPALGPVDPKAAGADKGLTLGTARAALLTIHGALRRFFPYFKVVGDQIDPRLDETMATVANAPTLDRKLFFDTVGRLGEAVHDGHNFIYDVSGAWSAAGYFPVIIDQVQGEPVIRKSAEPKVKPGEAITSIAGVPAGQWYAQEYPRTAGATPGYRFDLATRKYTQLFGPTAFGIRALDGGTRVETITPAPLETVQPLYADERHAERLGALGAPDLQYVNLDSAGLDEQHTCLAAMTQAQGAAGLVLDMRGYPGDEAWGCLGNLTNVRIWSPLWRVPQWTGPDTFSVDQSQWSVDPASPPFAGPIVLLVGPTTVSAAETVSTLLVDARRVKKVVGRTSAGTNGNITYLRTTAGIYFSFTGMEVLHTDGGTYHGIGIVPDVVVEPTAQDFADGRDRTIEAAIAALRAP